MLFAIKDAIDTALGLSLEARDLHWYHMALRALLTYAVVLVIVRSGHKRFLGKATAFDVVLGILIGSIASRAITGNAPLFPALVAVAVLVALHAVFAWGSFRWPRFSRIVEGAPTPLVRDGKMLEKSMRSTDVTRDDLLEAFRLNGHDSVQKIKLAQLERNGKISSVAVD